MTKRFGPMTALDNVSVNIPAGSFHALLGENGAGKSTLVKCIMGFYTADEGAVRLNGKEINISNPKDARANGIGMVYQHFTLVPSLTAAENLVINRADAPAIIDWGAEKRRLEAFLDKMPFRVPLNTPISSLAAGEKQKLEILKLLYLDQRFMILDEPTSVLTPGEADEILGLLKQMAQAKDITVVIITHKFREVTAFADAVTVLRRGKHVGGGKVGELTTQDMARMMIGDTPIRETAKRKELPHDKVVLDLSGLYAEDAEGLPAIDALNLKVHAGEIVGIAGVSGNGQSDLVEVLAGQRAARRRRHLHPRRALRADTARFRSLQGVRPARGAAEERHRAAHDGGREHGLPLLRQAAAQHGLVAVARTDAREGARADQGLSRQDVLARERRSRPSRAATCSAPCWRASCPATSTC